MTQTQSRKKNLFQMNVDLIKLLYLVSCFLHGKN